MHFCSEKRDFYAHIRPLDSISDCRGITECLRAVFGESYIKKDMYDPERIFQLQRDGGAEFYVAAAENGEIAGVIGCERVHRFPDTLEFCTLAVLPRYDGAGLGTALLRYIMEAVRGRGVSSIFSYPIASHIKAQRSIDKLSAVCCGFLPSVFSTEKFNSGYPGHTNPKDSLTVVALKMRKADAGTLYLKQEYLPLAKKVYSQLAVEYSVSSEESLSAAAKTEYEYSFDSVHSTLYININTVGGDLSELVKSLCAHKSDKWFTANLCLNINDSAAVCAASVLEENGFFFAGFHPLCGGREYCIYHYSGSVKFDIDDLDFIEGQDAFADCIRLHTKGSI